MIVGLAMFQEGAVASHAFVYSAGRMQDLNALIPAHSGWVLTEATSINDAGRIVGEGLPNGVERTFLLTPNSSLVRPRN